VNKLKEKRSLVELARRFGQEPESTLLEDIARLERDEEQQLKREAAIRLRIAEDLLELFNPEVEHELVQSPPTEIQEQGETNARPIATSDPDAPSSAATAPTIADRVARVITEQGVVAPDPVLAQPQKDLEREVKYLREWIGRIAATGAGSGEVNFRYLDDVDRSTINKDWYLTYNPSSKKFQFEDTRVSIEAFDRSTSIALTSTPQLLKPNSFTNSKNLTYDTSTGVFTFLTQCEVSLALTVNAVSAGANHRVYQYAERNTGTGFVPIPNSGKNFQLVNGQNTQIVNAQTISRLAGEQIRYFIYSDSADRVTLITETLPATSGSTVYVPAIRIQYAGR
jgi:hypothetical protein